MSPIAQSPFQTPAEACAAAQDWPEAADSLIELWVGKGYPFTSGHITDTIRRYRTEFVFLHASVGDHVRSAFYNDTLPSYNDEFGGSTYPVKHERVTSGQGRTPADTMVYVYSPNVEDADLFEFELSIKDVSADADGSFTPNAGLSPAAALIHQSGTGTGSTAPAGTTVPATPPNGHIVVAKGKRVSGDVLATVHPDGRICVPRIAFEALAQATGKPVTGGEPLYVAFIGTPSGPQCIISQHEKANYTPVTPTSDRLRLHLTSRVLLGVGDSYVVKVTGDTLNINLSTPV